jgi:hypothetical protein
MKNITAPAATDTLGTTSVVTGTAVGTTKHAADVLAHNNNVISSVNSRAGATLAAAATFQGTVETVTGYGRVGVSISADNATDGTLTLEVSHDNVTWGGPDRAIADTRFAQPVMWNIVEKYFRIKYVNGTTEATNLSIQTQYSSNADIILAHPLNETLIDEMGATLTRAVVAGADEGGTYRNVQTINKDDKTSIYTVAGFTDTQTVHLDVAITTTPMSFMLIDLSDTTNWPHTKTGQIILEYMVLEVDPGSTFVGEVRIGYLKNVDGTNGDFVTLFDVDMQRSASLLVETIEFGSHGMHCGDASHFGPADTNNTAYQTDVNLGGPDDPTTTTYPSGDGDLVLQVTGAGAGNGAVDVSITLGYETVT